MQFGVIVAPTIKELFIQKIESMILSGKLSVGDRLPSERELAEEMKVSKTVVHSGLKELERKGFVYVNAHQGTFIANYAENGTLETLSDILKHNGGRLDKENVSSILELRKAVEGITIVKFTNNHKPEDLEVLSNIVKEIKCIADSEIDYAKMSELFFDFHHYISIKSQNLILPIVFNSFHDISVVFFETSIKTTGIKESINQLDTLIRYINDKQGEEAVKYLYNAFDEYVAKNN